MISLFITAAVVVGAANVALVTFLADRLGPKAGTLATGELFAAAGSAPASGKSGAVRAGNENAPYEAAKRVA